MEYTLINTIAIAVLLSLAEYFILQSAEAVTPKGAPRKRDIFAVIFTAIIAIMLVVMAGFLLNPDLLAAPKPPPHIKPQWI